ncbi:MAG: type II toxin-antitoxin system VapC family toxin [Proteobacteria bacterium]|nr:type II toxin-antitoxin system VapC family toxin [Pseudomonadota bacterium]
MSASFLLDTNVISVPVRKVADPTVVARLERHADRCAIPAPVWHELSYGCQRLPPGSRRRALEAYLRDVVRPAFPILPYDEVAATWHAAERARLERAGKPTPYVDGQIAAIASVAKLTLVTGNTKDFRHFRDLAVTDWSGRSRRQ